ncbi:MAG TPA: MSHA biogenesis protein MshK [Janthinobacterium sp.]|nr:MSHA biogenesis protein MshK [Janthinobacterium sp.]
MAGLPSAAQSLLDPTRPPAAAMEARATPVGVAPTAAPQLQSVLISRQPGGRRVAVVNGQVLRLGGKVEGAVIVKMTDTEIVLRRGRAFETLKLFPTSGPDATIKGKN